MLSQIPIPSKGDILKLYQDCCCWTRLVKSQILDIVLTTKRPNLSIPPH